MRLINSRYFLTGVAVAALMLLLPVPATSVSSTIGATPDRLNVTAASDLDAGVKAVEQRHYEEATRLLTQAIDSGTLSNEGLALAYHHRGIARQKLGFSSMAVLDYTQAIGRDALAREVLARAYYNRGIAMADVGDKLGAEQDYTRAIDLSPDYAAAYHNRANLERARADYPTAIRDYSEAITLLNGDKRKLPLMGRALSYEKSGDVASAVADLNQALSIDPNYAPALQKHRELAALPIAPDNIGTGSIATPGAGLLPGRDRAIQTGWEPQATRFDKGAPVSQPAASAEERLETASLRAIDMVPAPSAVPPPSANGRYKMQLGAFRAAADAAKAWNTISQSGGTLVGSLDHTIEEADLGARGTYFRLHAGAFAKASDAKARCAALAIKKIDCIVVAR